MQQADSPPNYAAAKASYGIAAGPVVKQAFATYPFYERINGVMNIVYAYGGAMLFIEFMSEMRRPMDFWKAMIMAQSFILVVYMLFGLVSFTPEP